jgi:outer membrane immunogenic protein
MKKFLGTIAVLAAAVPIAAHAADLPAAVPAYRAPVYAPTIFTWTGFYIGGNIGAAWAQSEWTDSRFGLDWGRTSDARFIGGGQIGFNYQFAGSSFVIGAEADFDWFGNNNGNGVTVVGPLGHSFNIVSNDTRIATLAARFGYGFERALFYGKAGAGWVGNDGFTITDLTTSQSFIGSTSNTVSGWLVGAGIEYAFTNNWTVKLEYDFLGLPSRTFVLPGVVIPALAGDSITGDHNVQMVKLGVNYLFNWGGPVVARY